MALLIDKPQNGVLVNATPFMPGINNSARFWVKITNTGVAPTNLQLAINQSTSVAGTTTVVLTGVSFTFNPSTPTSIAPNETLNIEITIDVPANHEPGVNVLQLINADPTGEDLPTGAGAEIDLHIHNISRESARTIFAQRLVARKAFLPEEVLTLGQIFNADAWRHLGIRIYQDAEGNLQFQSMGTGGDAPAVLQPLPKHTVYVSPEWSNIDNANLPVPFFKTIYDAVTYCNERITTNGEQTWDIIVHEGTYSTVSELAAYTADTGNTGVLAPDFYIRIPSECTLIAQSRNVYVEPPLRVMPKSAIIGNGRYRRIDTAIVSTESGAAAISQINSGLADIQQSVDIIPAEIEAFVIVTLNIRDVPAYVSARGIYLVAQFIAASPVGRSRIDVERCHFSCFHRGTAITFYNTHFGSYHGQEVENIELPIIIANYNTWLQNEVVTSLWGTWLDTPEEAVVATWNGNFDALFFISIVGGLSSLQGGGVTFSNCTFHGKIKNGTATVIPIQFNGICRGRFALDYYDAVYRPNGKFQIVSGGYEYVADHIEQVYAPQL